jgi:hypothetical protein
MGVQILLAAQGWIPISLKRGRLNGLSFYPIKPPQNKNAKQ